jgi:hypothetical protein
VKREDYIWQGVERLIPILGWITLIGIALVVGIFVLGLIAVSLWLALLFFIKIIPIIILVTAAAIIWKVIRDRRVKGP